MIKEKQKLTGNLNAKQSLSSKLGNAIIYIDPLTQEKSVEPSKSKQIIIPDDGFNGLSKVTVNKIADSYIIPSGEIEIKENGIYDVTDKESVNVEVPEKKIGTKAVTSNGTYQAIDDELDGYNQVTVDVKTSNAWQRPTDWYNLPTILKNTENIVRDGVTYYPKIALQYISSGDTTNIYLSQYLGYPSSAGTIKYLVKTSDEQELLSTSSSINITWNRENEKDTRYAILFTNKDSSVALSQILPSTEATCIEMIVGNCTITGLLNIGANKPSLINVETLETTKFTSTTSQFANYSNNCQTVEHIYCPTVTIINSSFGSYRLQDIDFPQLKTIGSSGTF